jgi:hypothetical protein
MRFPRRSATVIGVHPLIDAGCVALCAYALGVVAGVRIRARDDREPGVWRKTDGQRHRRASTTGCAALEAGARATGIRGSGPRPRLICARGPYSTFIAHHHMEDTMIIDGVFPWFLANFEDDLFLHNPRFLAAAREAFSPKIVQPTSCTTSAAARGSFATATGSLRASRPRR